MMSFDKIIQAIQIHAIELLEKYKKIMKKKARMKIPFVSHGVDANYLCSSEDWQILNGMGIPNARKGDRVFYCVLPFFLAHIYKLHIVGYIL